LRIASLKFGALSSNVARWSFRRKAGLRILRLRLGICYGHRGIMKMKFWIMLGLGLLGLGLAGLGQGAIAANVDAAVSIDGWLRQLDRVEEALNNPNATPDQAEAARGELLQVRERAFLARAKAQDQFSEVEKLLASLGPAPKDGMPKEESSISEQRQHYGDELSQFKAQVQSADLILARVEALSDRISERWRFWAWGRMTKVFPPPWSIKVLTTAGSDLSRISGVLWQRVTKPSPTEPRVGLSSDTLIFGGLVSAIIWIALAAWLLARYGHRRVVQPSYARKLASAVAHANAYAILPGAWAFALGLWIESNGVEGLSAVQSALLAHGLEYGAMALPPMTLPAAIYAPSSPKWRLLPVSDDRARVVVRGAGLLGLATALDLFIVKTVLLVSPPSDQLASVYSAGVYSILALVAAWLVYASARSVFIAPSDAAAQQFPSIDPTMSNRSIWRDAFIVGNISALLVGVVALWVGYTNFGSYLVNATIIAGLTIGMMRAMRDLLSASLGLAIERRAHFFEEVSPQADSSPATSAFWAQLIIDVFFVLVGVLAVAVIWGVPVAELATLGEKALGSFRVGSVKVSPIDLLLGGLIFAAIVFAVRRIQNALQDSLLPRTRIDPGARQSIVTGTGYLGIGLAGLVSISAIGIDLSNLAIVAGALSVGIGFGLQNITNNFVSGLILLFERPVKVGDWVVVGTTEGLIKNINVRATEIETFDLASVIIPNAELLSNHLTNWTHKDRRGRVEIKISLHPNSDPDEVMAMLLDLARQNSHIVAEPPPWVTLSAILPGALEFSLRCFTDDVMQRSVFTSELRVALIAELRRRGIRMSDPALGQTIGPQVGPNQSKV
jgi:small-conductance mechanosensitive channel